MDNFPLQELNSQVAEQYNSKLKPLGSIVSYMGMEGFMRTVSLFMLFQNLVKKAKLADCPDFPSKGVFEVMGSIWAAISSLYLYA